MEFEDILKDVGGFGRYQKLLVGSFLIPACIVIPWFALDLIFLASTPDHWCMVPELAASNLSLQLQKSLIRPNGDTKCSMYDVNYSSILESGNWSVDPFWPTKKCNQGWQFDKSEYDATAATRWQMVCDNEHYGSLVLSLIFVGDVIGTPFYGYLSDKWGRKPTFFFLALISAVSEIGSVLSPNFVLFLLLRTVNGSCMSTIYGAAYIILLELVSPEFRAHMNGISTTSWTVGLCTLPLLAYLTRNWFYLSISTSSVAIALLFYWKFLPESPSWLVSQNRFTEAAEIMKKISETNGKSEHDSDEILIKIQRLSEKMKKEKAGQPSHSPMDFFNYPTLRKRFILVTLCWIGNSIPYFGLQMNVKNLGGSEFINFFLVSLVEVPSHLATWLFMERIGRRWCAVCAFIVSSTSCLLPVLFSNEYEAIGVVASLLAKAGSSSAFMTLYQQSPELYPTPLRGVGMGMSSTVATLATLTVPYIVYMAKFGKYIPFLVFSVISMLAAVCASFLPETLNKKLPQTVIEAENFGKNQKFFSCREKRNSDCNESTWTPATLSVADLSVSTKDLSDPTSFKYLKRDSSVEVSIVEMQQDKEKRSECCA